MLRRRDAVAGPTPVRVRSWVRAGARSEKVGVGVRSCGGGGGSDDDGDGSASAAKAAVVAALTDEGSFLRIWEGRKGRFWPWVLWYGRGH